MITAAAILLLVVLLVVVQVLDERATHRLAPWHIGPLHALWARCVTIPRALRRWPLLAVLLATPVAAQQLDTTAIRAMDSASTQAEIARARKTLDSLSREIDKLDSLDRRVRAELQRVFKARQWFGAALGAGIAANAIWKIDRDPGGYRDVWTTPDKRDHLNSGFFLSSAGMAMGVRPWWAAGMTCAAAAGFEVTQGYISSKDIIAGCAGATVASAATWFRKRSRGR